MVIERPPSTEYSSFAAGYAARIKTDVEPLESLQRQRDEMMALLRTVSEADASYRYAEGKWSIKQSIGHMTDAERVFSYRMLRIARGDTTALPGFDENAFVEHAAFDDCPIVDLVSGWEYARVSTMALARTIAGDAWLRIGNASNHPLSARGALYVTLGHTDHHREIFVERYRLSPAR